ncbi:hypothetical protein [Vulgatibacter sp.]|uniref:hypothetical protein n=1 Tax=Vulgatibacter sp. TaxID=1971226 RepID=UPI00356567B5
MFWRRRQTLEQRVNELEEENDRLAAELARTRETVAILRAQAASRSNLLQFWNDTRTDNERWLEAEITRMARDPFRLG